MEGFDDAGIFFSDNFSQSAPGVTRNDLQSVKFKFKEFLKQFHTGNFDYKYRDMLKQNYNLKKYYLEVNLEDLASFDEKLAEKLHKQPTEHLPVFEEAATDVADTVTSPRPPGEEEVESVQIMLHSNGVPSSLRDLKSNMVSQLVKIPGIVVSASGIKAKAVSVTIQCRSCGNTVPKLPIRPGLEGYALPRRCNTEQTGQTKCPLDPYQIRTDSCECVDFQILKLQEPTDMVPQGEMPRHIQLYVDRFLCDKVVPGNRVSVLGVYSIKKNKSAKKGGGTRDKTIGVRAPYIRVIGVTHDFDVIGGRNSTTSFTAEEEDLFRKLASSPNIYERIAKSVAPSIFGFEDIKKAISCLLFSGSRKQLPDGLTRRGDINILLLGDPGTAKSQMLKFVDKVSPIAVYTSGKGSSASGLTASVIKDPQSRNFALEGGAMVLADGGVVCIDEFDKMREDDRVAIHEAMEQQTISIAKAGLTTTLNSRCSVLAAANSVFGRWDETKGEENIDFMPTILSRFDMIFIVKDEHNQARDITIAKHIMNIHMKTTDTSSEPKDGELSLQMLKKYLNYCRRRCGPRLSQEAGEKLKTKYVLMREGTLKHQLDNEKNLSIPITVRQLEAIIRISEALAKMELQPFATERHVDEALRLFQVSTLDAAMSGSLAGADEFTTSVDHDIFLKIEKQLKRRFAVGVQVSEHTIINDFIRQKYPEAAIRKVIQAMIMRGELMHRMQRKLLLRIR
ncbi:minichromosome maintenance 5 [Rhodnius prolixus]|uniref:DNA replication licensing factor MCM5 n=1 Tax=Rhodnius prolixus TaxID=13249 RepID=T1I6R5_RHOPR